jgi:Tfp pilus assembly protein PilF
MKKEWCRTVLLSLVIGLGGTGIAKAETWAETQILSGQLALQMQDYSKAITFFTEALQVDTRNPLAQRGLQLALAQEAQMDLMRDQSEMTTWAYTRKLPQLAAEEFSTEQLSNVSPETPHKLYKKSLLVLAQLQHGDNIAAMRTAIPLPKRYGHPTAWNLVGLARYNTGDSVKAKLAFNRALQLNPSFHTARLNLATVFMTGGDFKNAEEQIKRVLTETNARHKQALLSMAKLKNLEGDKVAAEKWSARANEQL